MLFFPFSFVYAENHSILTDRYLSLVASMCHIELSHVAYALQIIQEILPSIVDGSTWTHSYPEGERIMMPLELRLISKIPLLDVIPKSTLIMWRML